MAGIKLELQTMSRDERLTLAHYLSVLNQLDEPAEREAVRAAMARMDQGRKISEEEARTTGATAN